MAAKGAKEVIFNFGFLMFSRIRGTRFRVDYLLTLRPQRARRGAIFNFGFLMFDCRRVRMWKSVKVVSKLEA